MLVAHHYLELSDDEAARMLDIPTGTYKSRLHRATAAMRAELDAELAAASAFRAGSDPMTSRASSTATSGSYLDEQAVGRAPDGLSSRPAGVESTRQRPRRSSPTGGGRGD